MAGKKIKLDEEAISEILLRLAIAIWKKKKRSTTITARLNRNRNRLQQVAEYQPGDCLKEGTQIFILLLVQQKV
jgi:hypothetical protein